MADKKTLLIVGVIGVGGIFFYEWWKKKQTAASSTTTASGGNSYISPGNGLTTLPATNPSASSAISANVLATVQKWGEADGRAPIKAMLAAMVPVEYNGMYDIIINAWDAGKPPTTAQQLFWDNLRTKYDPTHQVW